MKFYSAVVVILIAYLFILSHHKFPACSYAIGSGKSYSHILQFTVCLGQLYGCLVYFITAYLDGFNFWVSPFYFWAYFIGANSSWVVIPTLIAARSWKRICAAIHQSEKVKTK
jgi:cholestenol delta-isomerase